MAAFFLLALLLIFLSPQPAFTQKGYRIGALVAADLFVPAFEGFKKKMAELGYVEGKNVKYDFHNAKGDLDALNLLAQQLVQDKPDLIVTGSTTSTQPVAKASSGTSIPVVFLAAGNPLEFVKSYASSGNNLTGISTGALELTAKRLELLKDLAPWVKRVASLNNAQGINYKDHLVTVRQAGKKLGLTIIEINAASREELVRILPTITRKVADAIFLPPDQVISSNIEVVVKQAIREKLPVISAGLLSDVEKGGLAMYGPDYFALGQQGAVIVHKILKGARPTDLPIEFPLKLKLVINLKTAKAVGLRIPKEILLRADEVVE